MFQKTYILDETLTLDKLKRTIANDSHYQTCNACLIQVYEPLCDSAIISQHVRQLRECLPKAGIAGMTTLGPVIPEVKVPQSTMVTVSYFDESGFDIHVFDCHNVDPHEAGRLLNQKIAGTKHLKGVQLMTACATTNATPVIEKLRMHHPELPVFGGQAGTERIGEDHSLIFTDDRISDCGILAIVFHGENLHITTDYSLGWRPIGRELTITGTRGTDCVETIDYKPAVDVFRKYLDIDLNEAFYANVCAFPLLAKKENHFVARVPTNFTRNGGILLSAILQKGEKVTLSYTKPQYLLRSTLAAANTIAKQAPQAITLFACVNRRVCMGNDRADRELGYYRSICPELSYVYGLGELMCTPRGGELMNSTIVAAGMREGDIPEDFEAKPITDPELADNTAAYRPLPDRMSTFLETIAADLSARIEELEHLAQRDQLTGLYNRRRIDEIIEQRLTNQRRHNDLGFALLMYDIDHFKDVNDTYGHEAGDVVLKELTQRVRNIVRDDDVAGRWGGEEFLIVANNITLAQSESLAERIRKYVAATPFPIVGTVTISFGVTCARPDDTATTLFDRVDEALYDAKHSGRNCVVAHA